MEEIIINQAKNGDQKAQRELFEKYGRRMYVLCLRYVKIQQDAEEILSNGFVKAFASISSFENREQHSFEFWLKRILVNECLMFLRKQNKAPMMVEQNESMASTEETVIEKLSADELFGLILKLPEGYRTVFNLFEIEGYTHPEIAEKLSISVGTSKSQLSKAKAAMKVLINKNGLNHAS